MAKEKENKTNAMRILDKMPLIIRDLIKFPVPVLIF